MRVRGLSQTHSSTPAVISAESTPASSGERPGGSAVLHPRPLSKQACMRNSCIRGKQTDTSRCLHTHLLPRSHRRALKNALMQITYIKTSVPLGGELLSSTARSCTLKKILRGAAHTLQLAPDLPLLLFRCREERALSQKREVLPLLRAQRRV